MNILLEVNPLMQRQRTGVAEFIFRFSDALLTEGARDSFELWAPDVARNPFPNASHARFRGNNVISRAAWEEIWQSPYPGLRRLGRVSPDFDIYHVTYSVLPAPRRSRCTKLVVTVYDLAFARFPEALPSTANFRYLSHCLARQVEEADHIVAISHSTKRDLQLLLKAPDEKIEVIYPATELQAPSSAPDDAAQAAFDALGLPPRYILCVGTWEPRKNLLALLHACHSLRGLLSERGIRLCLCGGKGWKYESIERAIEELELNDLVIRLGYVERNLLPMLYARSLMFVYPSLYEGFGLPVLEAMQCDTPVVTTNVSSLPEVAGDAALLVDPHSGEDLADAMLRLLGDEKLRQELIARGREQAQKFSWRDNARRTLDLYRRLS